MMTTASQVAMAPSKATCWFCNKALPKNDVLELYPYGRRVAYDAATQRYWVVCLGCGKWCLTTMEDDQRAETIGVLERWWSDSRTRYSTGGIGLGEHPSGMSVVRIGESNWKEFAHWRHEAALRRRYKRTWALNGAFLGAYGVMLATGWLNWGGALALSYLAVADPMFIGRALCRIPGDARNRLVFQLRQMRNMELAKGNSGNWSLNVQHVNGVSALTGSEAIRALGYVLPVFNRNGMSGRVVSDAMEMVSAAGGPEALAERAAEPVVSGSRRSEEAVRLTRYKPVVRAALEIATQEHTERRLLENELALLRSEWKDAETHLEHAG
jgi:hypothetical protein